MVSAAAEDWPEMGFHSSWDDLTDKVPLSFLYEAWTEGRLVMTRKPPQGQRDWKVSQITDRHRNVKYPFKAVLCMRNSKSRTLWEICRFIEHATVDAENSLVYG